MSMNTPRPEPGGLDGLRVVVFEARMADALADLVTKRGGEPVSAPALKEIPLGTIPEVVEFVDQLGQGAFDLLIFETGAGVRYLVDAFRDRTPAIDWPALLASPRLVARGPKPASALRALGVTPDLQVPEPNTWRETLTTLDEHVAISGLKVAVLEYGKPGPELIEGLQRRGAEATRVPIYRWALPDDREPIRSAVNQLIEGSVGAALFTAGQQVENLLRVADDEGLGEALRSSLRDRIILGSVGPSTSSVLRSHGLPIDIEPEHPKSGHLIAALTSRWRDARDLKSG